MNLIDKDVENLTKILTKILINEKIKFEYVNLDKEFYLINIEEEKILNVLKKYGFELNEEYRFFHKKNYGRILYSGFFKTLKVDYGLKIAGHFSEVNLILKKLISSLLENLKNEKVFAVKSYLDAKKLYSFFILGDSMPKDVFEYINFYLNYEANFIYANSTCNTLYYKGLLIAVYPKSNSILVEKFGENN